MSQIAEAQTPETQTPGRLSRLYAFASERRSLLRDYATAVSGSAGRLIFSLLYFVALANALSIAEFGLFATASAAGVMLSRILAFGFISAVYRIATIRPRLVGLYTGGFLFFSLLSFPALAAASAVTYVVFFRADMAVATFACVVAAEALLWRPAELVVIINNGMGRFGRAAILVILGTVMRAVAALAFIALPTATTLTSWVWLYLAANAAVLLVAVIWFQPRQRIRLRPRHYWRRLPDSLYVASAEVLFYLQMELDKLLVLALSGPKLAGIYAIIMRLVDLTAIPIRTFTMMLVQRLMRAPQALEKIHRRVGIEFGIFAVSTLGLLALGTILYVYPSALGANVAEVTPLVVLALFVPGLRNLAEYQAELLYARGQTFVRAMNLAILGACKVALLTWLLSRFADAGELVLSLNFLFAALYLVSTVLTYTALRRPAKAL